LVATSAFFFPSLFCQFCNVAEVVIISEMMIKANLARARNPKKNESKKFEYNVCYPTGA